jgi:hypothetical protein
MADEFFHDNPQDPVEERLVGLEEKFVDIYCNMSSLMVALESTLTPFKEVLVSNS